MKAPRVEILCVGTELLSGKINTHMAYLAPALRGVGLSISRETSVGDSVADISDAVAGALSRAEIVIVTGGLGPTFDDLTREGVAQALGRRMAYRPSIFEKIRRRFLRYGRAVPEINKRQAYVIEGAVVLPNHNGTAPGQRVSRGDRAVFLLPGPGSEMRPMVERRVLPHLRKRYMASSAAAKTVLHLAGISESAADERLDPLYRSADRRGVEFTILSEPGLVDLHISAAASSAAQARRRVAAAAAAARRLVGRWGFGTDDDTPESVAGAGPRRRGRTLLCQRGEGARARGAPGRARPPRRRQRAMRPGHGGGSARAMEVRLRARRHRHRWTGRGDESQAGRPRLRRLRAAGTRDHRGTPPASRQPGDGPQPCGDNGPAPPY
ncbi:MAG: competence/damage-inducible protein A [Elusimicrobia bacterium]|nr:competence/damage-inducible protein A [Elusimicrobiota bacterium]